ncbi:MAG: hypothetical protein JNJ78_15095 [Anaerolineae bacterium]|nr:hypothetical protein [Anaerolineae bacterium]
MSAPVSLVPAVFFVGDDDDDDDKHPLGVPVFAPRLGVQRLVRLPWGT